MSSIFQTKSVDQLIAGTGVAGSSMKRTLTTFDLVMLGIGAVIGAGIFSSIGTAAVGEVAPDGTVIRYGAGPALTLSFVLLGAVCALAGLCYAELTAMIPVSGSAYTYAYATLGELVAWIIGWDLILEYAVGNVAVAVAWSGYFASFFRFFDAEIPFWLCHSYRDVAFSYPESMDKLPIFLGHHIAINIPAMVIVGLITWLLVIGVKESARVNNVMVAVKLGSRSNRLHSPMRRLALRTEIEGVNQTLPHHHHFLVDRSASRREDPKTLTLSVRSALQGLAPGS